MSMLDKAKKDIIKYTKRGEVFRPQDASLELEWAIWRTERAIRELHKSRKISKYKLSHNNVFYGKDDDLKKFKEDLKKRIKENDTPSYLKPIGEARLYFELHPDKVVTRKELGEEIEESWKNLSSTLQRLYEKGEIGKYKTSYHKTHWGKPKAIKEFKDKKENQIVTKQDEIEDFLDKDGHVFELKEILEEFDNNAKSTINSHLKQLERKGKVEHFVFEQLKLWGTPDNINKLKNKIQKEVKKIED